MSSNDATKNLASLHLLPQTGQYSWSLGLYTGVTSIITMLSLYSNRMTGTVWNSASLTILIREEWSLPFPQILANILLVSHWIEFSYMSMCKPWWGEWDKMISFSPLDPTSAACPRHLSEKEGGLVHWSKYRGLFPEGRMYPGQHTAVAHSTISPEVLTFWCVLFKSYFLRILFTSRFLLCCFFIYHYGLSNFPRC